MYSAYEDDIDLHTGTLDRCKRMPHYRVIEVHIPGIQGPGGGSSGGGSDSGDSGGSGSDDNFATDEDIENLFPSQGSSQQPSTGGGNTNNGDGDGDGDDKFASDEDIENLFPGS